MKRALFILLLLCAVLFSGCSSQSQQGAEKKVYASTYPVYYLTRRIAENGIEVAAVVPSSADPHNWEPSPRQMAELESCKLFIYNGAGLEPWADKVSSLAGDNDTAVLELASVFQGQLIDGSGEKTGSPGERHPEDHNHEWDPHFWLDPVMAKEMAVAIREALIQVDPDNKELYVENCAALEQDLDKLHEEYTSTLSRCRKKEFVVTHQAFGYLAKRYGLEQISVMGISSESEPSPSRLAELTKLLKESNIRCIFTEPFTGEKVAQTLAAETGGEVLELNPIGGLTETQMESGEDYLSIMRKNLEQLKVALEYE